MKKLIFVVLTIIYFLIINSKIFAGTFIDTVYSFKPGFGQNAGQSPEYFPKNIFGPPSSSASWTVPESRPEELCSIGLNGEIIVGLKNGIIRNGPGVDFVIFENAFERLVDGKIFAEPAIISVSQNGTDFISFPYNEWTLDGMAGKTPTVGSQNPFNYPQCGGDGFDLEVLGLDYITHIKIHDVSLLVTINETHPYYQPPFIVSGFDLDAVAIMYPDYTNIIENKTDDKVLIDIKDKYCIISSDLYEIDVFNINGLLINKFQGESIIIYKDKLPSGLIFFVLKYKNGSQNVVKKINYN